MCRRYSSHLSDFLSLSSHSDTALYKGHTLRHAIYVRSSLSLSRISSLSLSALSSLCASRLSLVSAPLVSRLGSAISPRLSRSRLSSTRLSARPISSPRPRFPHARDCFSGAVDSWACAWTHRLSTRPALRHAMCAGSLGSPRPVQRPSRLLLLAGLGLVVRPRPFRPSRRPPSTCGRGRRRGPRPPSSASLDPRLGSATSARHDLGLGLSRLRLVSVQSLTALHTPRPPVLIGAFAQHADHSHRPPADLTCSATSSDTNKTSASWSLTTLDAFSTRVSCSSQPALFNEDYEVAVARGQPDAHPALLVALLAVVFAVGLHLAARHAQLVDIRHRLPVTDTLNCSTPQLTALSLS